MIHGKKKVSKNRKKLSVSYEGEEEGRFFFFLKFEGFYKR